LGDCSKMIKFNGVFELDDTKKILQRHGLNDGGVVQKFVDNEVLRRCAKYIPFRTGALMNMGIMGTVIGSGEVAWIGVKPRYLYYGKVMVGPAPKTVTDKDLTYYGGPQRGAFWFERMKAAEGQEIVKGVQELLNGGN